MSDYSKYKDAELVAEFREGKAKAEKAFAEIYTRYSQRVYAYCLRMTGDEDDAKDIFHEAFVKFFDIAKSKKYLENISGLLITISRNMIINKKRHDKISVNIEDYNVASHDRGYDEKELLQLISRALELLDFDYREAFILRLYHGLSYNDISKITGESIAAVRNRAWRAKEKIKDILAPYLEDLSN
jgi:RNA polymerase sigma-70 factor (ECF subfamily)